MSCTIFALPFTLAWIIGSSIAGSVMAVDDLKVEDDFESKNETYFDTNGSENIQPPCEEVHVISEKQFLEKSFETPFMDKDILLKTLSEHGIENLKENEYGQIKGNCGNYELTFEKNALNSPYNVVIRYFDNYNIDKEMNSLNSEYAINVQEQSYNHIMEKLKDNNMTVEDEEIQEDNTIVITVNLD